MLTLLIAFAVALLIAVGVLALALERARRDGPEGAGPGAFRPR
jgi:hypothetical protein